MYSRIMSGAVFGVQAYLVGVEVDIAQGLPGFSMVGSLSNEVRESRERVHVALKNVGLHLPPTHITVNLSPADRRKEGTAFDLSIAVGILQSMDYFQEKATKDTLFLGELGLDGEVKSVPGVLPIVREAANHGLHRCIVPKGNAVEGAVIPGIEVRGVESIRQLLEYLQAPEEMQDAILPICWFGEEDGEADWEKELPDFAEVAGQRQAKRAAEIAAAGFHNLLMVGPPGAGKSMIAKRIPGILPALTLEESLEVTSIASIAGVLGEEGRLIRRRPFLQPHHTISYAALVGGGSHPRPGVISLAHRGVLFLDELPEFQRYILDCMRQPIEEHRVHISRVGGNVTYPADFMLVCAMNPCVCGYYPDTNRCRCTQPQIKRYMSKVSGPILDRIDLCVEVQPVDIFALQKEDAVEDSATIRRRVERARLFQKERFQGTGYRFNADVESGDMERFFALGEQQRKCVENIYHSLKLSARAYHRIIKVARTIADLAGEEAIGEEHLMEAAMYRPSTEYWI